MKPQFFLLFTALVLCVIVSPLSALDRVHELVELAGKISGLGQSHPVPWIPVQGRKRRDNDT